MEKADAQTAIGFGFVQNTILSKIGYSHTGRIDEFRAAAAYLTDDNLSVIILPNGTSVKLNDIVVGIASKYYNTKYKKRILLRTKMIMHHRQKFSRASTKQSWCV